MDENKGLQNSAELLRIQLGSINWKDIHQVEKLFNDIKIGNNEQTAKQITIACETFYKEYGESILKLMLFEQLRTIGATADNRDKLQFGRGTFNGIFLLDEWFKGEYKKSLARFQKVEGSEDLTGIKGRGILGEY